MSVDKFGRQSQRNYYISQKRGPPGEGYKFNAEGNFDFKQNRLVNVNINPIDDNELVTKLYVDSLIVEKSAVLQSSSDAIITLKADIKNNVDALTRVFDAILKEQLKQEIPNKIKNIITDCFTKQWDLLVKQNSIIKQTQTKILKLKRKIEELEERKY